MLSHLVILSLAFVAVWLSSGLVISAVEKISSRLHLSQFTISLFLLGTATSTPEIAVALNSTVLGIPQVALGNLIGGQVLLLFGIIPLFAILSRGIKLQLQMQGKLLLATLITIGAPIIVILDQAVTRTEALIILAIYALFVILFAQPMSLSEKMVKKLKIKPKIKTSNELVKIGVGVAILLVASNLAVREINAISTLFNFHRFLVSLVIMAIGTNLPELSLALRSILGHQKDIALGDYIGSITFNTLLMGLLVLFNDGLIILDQTPLITVSIFLMGIVAFWYFCRSQRLLSSREAVLLLFFYIAFVGATMWQEINQAHF